MRNFTLDILQFITSDQIHPNFILQTPIKGLEFPETRQNYYSKPGQDGGSVSSQFYDKRSIELVGTVMANNPTDFENARKLLAQVCSIAKDSNGYPVPKRMTFTTLANNTYFLDVFLDQPVYALDNPLFSKFMITALSVNPFLKGSSISSGQIMRASGGGFILPVTLPIVSSAGTGGSGTVTNPGNAPAYPIITITGPMTSPYIQNQTTGKFIQLNTTIASGDVVTIDMSPNSHSIKLNNSQSLINAKSGDWWSLLPGDNLITLSTQNSSDTGNVVVSGNAAYLGV